MKKLALRQIKTPALIFLLTLTVYLSNIIYDFNKNLELNDFRRMMVSADIVSNTFLPWVLLDQHTIKFDKVKSNLIQFDANNDPPYFLIDTGTNYYSSYPILTGIMALPFYVLPYYLGKIPNIDNNLNLLKIFFIGRVAASFYTTLAVLIYYYILKEISKNELLIITFTFFYAFGTISWSVASRGLWQHTISQVFIAAVILLLLKAKQNSKLIGLIGFFVGLTVLVRPTNFLVAIFVSVYVLTKYKEQRLRYIFWGMPALIFLLGYNYYVFGSVFSEGYGARNDFNWSTPLSESLTGFAISPARSFLFISPPLVLAFISIFKIFINKNFFKEWNLLVRYISLVFISSLVLFAKWYTWDGANAFGHRMLLDYLPILGLLAFIAFEKLKSQGKILILLLILYSVLINANAVFNRKSRCDREHNWSFYCLSPPDRPSNY
ncbi:MAG: hypothetical protein ACOZAO_04800 [Patescibacteria group bacterium]